MRTSARPNEPIKLIKLKEGGELRGSYHYISDGRGLLHYRCLINTMTDKSVYDHGVHMRE